jgi:RNA polymerase sigma-70 factor (ECF subfamily)
VRDNPADALLARLVAAGDASAFAALYERHARGIYLLAYPVLGPDAASDLVQDVFMTVWQKAHQFDDERGGFRTWLTAIARHRIVDLAQRRSREHRVAVIDLADRLEQLADQAADVAGDAEASVESKRVLRALGELPAAQRQALLLVYFGGYTHRDLAELLGWPLGTVKKRVRLGLSKLAVLLDSETSDAPQAAEEARNEL